MIETIKTDLPPLFDRDISYDIYARYICFTDPKYLSWRIKLSSNLLVIKIIWPLVFHPH